MLWGVEGLGLSLGQSLPLLCQRLAGSGGGAFESGVQPPLPGVQVGETWVLFF